MESGVDLNLRIAFYRHFQYVTVTHVYRGTDMLKNFSGISVILSVDLVFKILMGPCNEDILYLCPYSSPRTMLLLMVMQTTETE
jgi:hypothetical protein